MSTELVHLRQESTIVQFDDERRKLLRNTICPKDITNDEFDLFVAICNRTGLDPFARHIYAIRRNGIMKFEPSIDGARIAACRTGQYEGQVGPFWCGKDGKWADVWLSNESPMAAKVGVLRSGFREPSWGVALFTEFAPYFNGKLGTMWQKMPSTMLAKCAESQSLRKAFPAELSGLYTTDEMGQSDNVPTVEIKGRHVNTDTGEIYDAGPRTTEIDSVKQAADAEETRRTAAKNAQDKIAAKEKANADAKTAYAAFSAKADALGYSSDMKALARILCKKDKPLTADLEDAMHYAENVWTEAIDEAYAQAGKTAEEGQEAEA